MTADREPQTRWAHIVIVTVLFSVFILGMGVGIVLTVVTR
jgi:hypothetical protein